MKEMKNALVFLLVFVMGAVSGGFAISLGGVWRAGAIGFFLGATAVVVPALWVAQKKKKGAG